MPVLEALGITSEELINRAIEDIKAKVLSDINDAVEQHKSELKKRVAEHITNALLNK